MDTETLLTLIFGIVSHKKDTGKYIKSLTIGKESTKMEKRVEWLTKGLDKVDLWDEGNCQILG